MQNKQEKPKFKHNKKRNTAFLFESLVRELTKSILYNEKDKQKLVSGIIREHFKKNSALDKELSLYKQFYETKQFPKEIAEKFVQSVKTEHEKLNETEVYNEQSRLISKINKLVGFQVYDNFVPNYKTLATISQVFNKNVEPKKKVLLEQELIEGITLNEQPKAKKLEPIDNLTLKTFIANFNQTYNPLIKEQKELLSKYISNTEDDLELKIYLNEEISRIKQEVSTIKENKDLNSDTELSEKIKALDEGLQSLKIENIDEQLIKRVMLIQEFINEVKN
jgi:hypothetical protein